MPQKTMYSKFGEDRNYRASAALTGGQIVQFTGDKAVGPAAASSLAVAGWIPYDVPTGELAPVQRSGVVPCLAASAIPAGARVVAAANGQVAAVPAVTTPTAADVTNTRAIIGTAEVAIAAGAEGPIALNIQ